MADLILTTATTTHTATEFGSSLRETHQAKSGPSGRKLFGFGATSASRERFFPNRDQTQQCPGARCALPFF
ncbi:hypothetical protein Y1Q_0002931 [Alligator mississippiensis]|uniref:Uncharacterized protein n=1 Tax=Alligator mississippiensis TaxID=8496 RepID=A0A151MCS1_ALLMI|nr:hypothetical protein Y1Q_0002931 [Alligator mississippiensis]